jgi:hypothetical protein
MHTQTRATSGWTDLPASLAGAFPTDGRTNRPTDRMDGPAVIDFSALVDAGIPSALTLRLSSAPFLGLLPPRRVACGRQTKTSAVGALVVIDPAPAADAAAATRVG